MITKILTFVFSALSFTVLGQQYIYDQSPEVIVNNLSLKFPWIGGLNSAQINTIDLNSDGLQDIIAFERSTLEIFTFIATDEQNYSYKPQYTSFFPEIYGWIITRDINGDGKKDIFTGHALGIQVYINELPSGFKPYPVAPIMSRGNTGPVNIYVSEQDLPAIEDVDGDGDLDIVSMQFAGTSLEYHQNQQVELGLQQDTLVFQKETEQWGNIRLCDCDHIISAAENCPDNGRTEHSVGHSLLLLDLDGDDDLDLAVSDNGCYNLRFLENTGTSDYAILNTKPLEDVLPNYGKMPYPTPAYVDVDHDGVKDLITSPGHGNYQYSLDYSASVWHYKNSGVDKKPNFTLLRQDFLQNEMIDVGQNAYPVFYDLDNDGDSDLFVGKLVDFKNNFRTGISYYENTGTYGNPSFELVTKDVFSFSAFNHYNIKPQFIDITGDRRPELVFSATGLASGMTSIYYFKNTGQVQFNSDFEVYTLHEGIPFNSNYLIYDLDDNGRLDLLITTPTGVQRFEKRNNSLEHNDYELLDERYLNLPANTNTLSVGDIDGDDTDDFIYSALGKGYVIYNFKNNSEAEEIHLSASSDQESVNSGRLLQIRPVKLLGNDLPELMVGKNTGGLSIFKSENAVAEPENDLFVAFPDPADQKENLNFQASRNMLLFVSSADGKMILGPEFVPSNERFEIRLRNLATGMYIINALIDDKTTWQKKFVVIN